MNFSWTPEQLKIKKSIIRFARESLRYEMIENDRDEVFNRNAWDKCAEFGVQGWPIPTAYGGQGLDITTTVCAMQALGYASKDNGLLFGISAHLWACEMPLLAFGSEAQKEQYLPLLSQGKWIASHAMTELQAGSDISSLTTVARKNDDKYILNGAKHYVTNGAVADLFIVFATVDPELGQKGLTCFIIERDNPGLIVTPRISTMGNRTAQVTQLRLENCAVPVTNRLGDEGAGMTIFSHSMEWERGFILSSAVGSMERLLEQSIKYARRRNQNGQPIAKFQLVSSKLVDMKMRIENAQSYLYKMAWLKDSGRIAVLQAAMTNLYISEAWVQSCINAIEVHGGNGYLTEAELERELRDAMGSKFYSGTSDIQRVVIGKLMGL